MIQTLEIDWPVEFEGLHCPFCGSEVSLSDNPCPHVDFVYLPEIGDFSFTSPAFQPTADTILAKVEAANEKLLNDEDVDTNEMSIDHHLLALPSHGSNFIFTVIIRGMACGPTTDVGYYGFDAVPNES